MRKIGEHLTQHIAGLNKQEYLQEEVFSLLNSLEDTGHLSSFSAQLAELIV